MSEESIVAIILGVLTIVGGGGLWTYLSSRKEAPVKKRDADIAAAQANHQMALAVSLESRELADDVREELRRVRTELRAESDARGELTERVSCMERHSNEQDRTIEKLRRVVNAFSLAWDDLVERWDEIRHQKTPPRRPEVHHDP